MARQDPKSTSNYSTVEYLQELDGTKPFFAYVNYHAVHLPLREEPGLVAKYQQKLDKEPAEISRAKGLEFERERVNKQVQVFPNMQP